MIKKSVISAELKNIVESIIFASDEEIGPRQIKEIIDKGGLRISIAEVEEAINMLNDEYKSGGKSFEILRIAGGFSFATRKEYGRFIGRLFEDKQKKKLSPSALETLAIIAYKQPITRSEIEFIRGVNVDYIVNSLLEKEMITIHGRAEAPGRPILYGTTKTFLKILGLNSLEDLPRLKEINEILKDQEIEGITEADIELFNSVNYPDMSKEQGTEHQLELISNVDPVEHARKEIEEVSISEGNIEENIEFEIPEPEGFTESKPDTEFDSINIKSEKSESEITEGVGTEPDVSETATSGQSETENNLKKEIDNFKNEREPDLNESESKE